MIIEVGVKGVMARYVLLFVTLAWSGLTWAQDLGEAARKEKERRAANKKPPAPAFTQDNLSPGASPAPESSPGARPGAARASKKAPSEEEEEPPSRAQADDADARYRSLAEPLRARLASCRQQLSWAEKRLKEAEEEKWGAGPSLPYRDYLGAEVERAKRVLEEQRRDCDGIEDEARRAGIPPGYLR